MASFDYDVSPGDWKPLSDIMSNDYETTTAYKVRVNSGIGCLRVLETLDTPDNNQRGREYPPFTELGFQADTGDDTYLTASMYPINIYVEEVPAS